MSRQHDQQPGNRDKDREARADDTPAVRTSGLHRSFKAGNTTVHAVNDVDLTVDPGTTAMIVGPSGCGKTTLLSLIAGVLTPDEGDAEVFGTRWDELSESKRVRKRGELIGFVFQQFNIIPTLTTLENAAIPAILHDKPRREAEENARQRLDDVGLADRAHDTPDKLSGGMLQRLAIARALVADPALLICDEPTANLDAETGGMIMDLLDSITQQHDEQGRKRTVLAVTHDQRIFHYADVIHEMDDGRLVDQRTPQSNNDQDQAPNDQDDNQQTGNDQPDKPDQTDKP